jgi:prolyl-tRNA synthetase
MVLTDAGEDEILYCESCDFCVNVEIAKIQERDKCPTCGNSQLQKAVASEVGNVFDLGQKYGKDFNLGFVDRNGVKQFPFMGCYGIGISRIMGVIVEKYNDERGIIWPETVAPYKVHLVGLDLDTTEEVKKKAESLYALLESHGVEVLYDDREGVSAGEKFADADLIGCPYRVVVSKRTQDSFEFKKRAEQQTIFMTQDELLKLVS